MPASKKPPEVPLKVRKKKPTPPLSKVMLPIAAIGSGGLLTLALPSLIGADSPVDYLKCGLIGASGTFISYIINRFAIEKGAFQAAIGSLSAGVVSTVSVLLVGTSFFTATYAGFVIEETDRLRIHEYAMEKQAWTAQRMQAQANAASMVPALNAMIDDLGPKVQCERTSSCVSGIGNGGEGDVFRKLSGALGNAIAVRTQLTEGQQAESAAAGELAHLQDALRKVVSDGSLSAAARRLQAQQIAQNTGPALGALEQAAPLDLVSRFASQLLAEGGSTPQDRLLASYGAQIIPAAQTQPNEETQPPTFPMPTGVSDTLRFIGHFLPIALLVAVIELILPMTLWFYTFTDLRARLEQEEAKPPASKRRRTPSTPKSSRRV